jgi:hypothetical protein
LVAHYESQIKIDARILPKALTDDLKDLKDSPEYTKLIWALSEWMVLIELCKDLLNRIDSYKLSVQITGVLDGKIEKGWEIQRNPDQNKDKSRFKRVTYVLSSFQRLVSTICGIAGITDYY